MMAVLTPPLVAVSFLLNNHVEMCIYLSIYKSMIGNILMIYFELVK